MKQKTIMLFSAMCLLTFTAAAANETELLKSGMEQAWLNSMGTDVQAVLSLILAGLVVAVAAAYVAFTLLAGINIRRNIDSIIVLCLLYIICSY